MFKSCEDQIDILGICVDEPLTLGRFTPINFHPTHCAQRALEALRDGRFDLLLVGSKLPDLNTWNFLRLMDHAYPRQKWALVGSDIHPEQKIIARSLGAIALFDFTPCTLELLNLVNRHRQLAIENVLSGRFGESAKPAVRALAG